jgi:DNA repair protein RecO (recombination protein O)
MNRIEGEALVLRVVEHGESDLIVRLLHPGAGRMTAIAKGARRSVRRFPGTLDVFNLLHVTVRRRSRLGMGFLEQARLLSPHLGLRLDARRYALASYLLELLDRMAPEDAHGADARRIFSFARGAMDLLARSDVDLRMWLLLELRALDALGLRPELGRCVRCGKLPPSAGAVRLVFHIADGGLLCAACRGEREGPMVPVHLGTLKVLQQGLDYDVARLGRLAFSARALAEARQLLFRFQRFHVGMELRSERFLTDLLDTPRAASESQAPPGHP